MRKRRGGGEREEIQRQRDRTAEVISVDITIENLFSFIFISWRLITLHYCSGFCHTLT